MKLSTCVILAACASPLVSGFSSPTPTTKTAATTTTKETAATVTTATAATIATETTATSTPDDSAKAPEKSETPSESFVVEEIPPVVAPPAPLGPTINGWTPDASQACFGLPGAIEPLGYFDPLGLCKNRNLMGVKRFREAEVVHGRVAMMATVGYLVGENTPTIAYGFQNPTIANNQIPEMPLFGLMIPLFVTINIVEAVRADIGWVEPTGFGKLFALREDYYPGDVGFDPFGLKPKKAENFASMQAKELSNGRLAMIAAAGMCVQELVNGKPVLADVPFL